MADTVGEFLIKLGLDANGLDKQLNSVVGNVKSGLSNLMSGVVGPALAGLAGAGFVQSFADEITQVSSLSDALGVNIETLSAWRTAAEMAGVEADEVGEIFADFNDWMVDAKFNEGGAMYTDFISNGLLPAVTDANGEMKKTEDYILEFADALHNMDQAQASGIARQIGVSDLKTATWLQQGGDAIRRQLELAKEIGTFTEEDALAAKEYSMSVTVLTHSIKMGLLPIFRAVVPTLTNIAKGFREMVKQVEPYISSFGKKLGDVFTQASSVVGSALKILADNIIAIAPLLAGLGVMKLVSVFKNMAGAIKTASIAAKAFILSPWGIVLTSLVAIGFAIQDFMKWLNGGDSVLSGFFKALFGDTESAKQAINDTFSGIQDAVSKVAENFSTLIPKFMELGKAVITLFSAIISSKGFELIVNVIVAVIGFIVGAITGFIGFLFDNSDVIVSIIGGIADAFTFLIGVMTSIVNFISSLITSIVVIVTALGKSLSNLAAMLATIFGAIGNALSPVIDVISGVIDSIISVISGGINSITDVINQIADGITSTLSGVVSGVKSIAEEIANSIIGGLSSAENFSLLDVFSSLFGDVDFDLNFEGITDEISSTFGSVYDVVSSIVDSIINLFAFWVNAVVNAVGSIVSALSPIIDIFQTIYQTEFEVITAVINLFVYLVDSIFSGTFQITDALNMLMSTVMSIGSSVSNMFSSMASSFSSFVSSVVSGASSIVSSITDILGKLAELASNSLLGKVIGSAGGSIYGAISSIGNTDNSSTVNTNNSNNTTNTYNYYGNGSGLGIDFRQGGLGY